MDVSGVCDGPAGRDSLPLFSTVPSAAVQLEHGEALHVWG